MKKLKLVSEIVEQGVVAVLRGTDQNQVVEMAEQAIAGGIKVIEVTMTVPLALRAVENLTKRYSSTTSDPTKYAIIGVGTVLDPETAKGAIESGAQFIVGPSLNPDTVRLCNRYRVPVMPGVMTVKELQEALELGVDIVKLFPGNVYSPSVIKALNGPLPQANIMPTGGVTLDNLADWVTAGAVAVGIGSDLTAEAVKTGNFRLVATRASQYVNQFRAAKRGTSVEAN